MAGAVLVTGCAGPTLSGKTVQEVFADPQVAALAEAAAAGDVWWIETLVRQGVDVNQTGYREMTPLVWAMYARNRRGVEALLQRGADPSFKVEGDLSATWLAAGGNDSEMLRLILAHGGAPNIVSGWKTALMVALEQRREAQFQMLLEAGADINQESDHIGSTVATYAAARGYFDKVALLLERGYSHDLMDLAGTIDVVVVAKGGEHDRWKQQVIKMLEERGIKYPLPPIQPLRPPIKRTGA